MFLQGVAFEMRAPGSGVLHDQRVVLAQAVGVGEQRSADRARLRDAGAVGAGLRRCGSGWLRLAPGSRKGFR
jgi:hypothetical protein